MRTSRVEMVHDLEHHALRQVGRLLSLRPRSHGSLQMRKKPEPKRRTPHQSRAQRTISELFEATVQLLDVGAPERLTTNHVAARAGYSIGTLYRYFPSKVALVQAMALEESRRQEAKVQAAIDSLMPVPGAEPVIRILVRAVLYPFGGRYRVHAGIVRLLATACHRGAAAETQSDVMSARAANPLASIPSTLLMELSDITKFTMIHAVTGAIEAALRSNPDLIRSCEFEDQLVRLIKHFLDGNTRCA